MPTSYCLGCNSFQFLINYLILPNSQRYKFPLCGKCKEQLEVIVANAELRKGGWKEPRPMEIPRYFHLLQKFVMGKK